MSSPCVHGTLPSGYRTPTITATFPGVLHLTEGRLSISHSRNRRAYAKCVSFLPSSRGCTAPRLSSRRYGARGRAGAARTVELARASRDPGHSRLGRRDLDSSAFLTG